MLENRSERNRWISQFTQFSTLETLDRRALIHMVQSIRVRGKKELDITFSPVVEVVYLTCQYKKPMPTHVRIESAGKRSTVLCEQISSVDVSRLGDFKGHLTDREMAQVDVALMASLDLHPITCQTKVKPVGPDVDDSALALIALRFLEGFLQRRCGVTVPDRLSIDLLGQKND